MELTADDRLASEWIGPQVSYSFANPPQNSRKGGWVSTDVDGATGQSDFEVS